MDNNLQTLRPNLTFFPNKTVDNNLLERKYCQDIRLLHSDRCSNNRFAMLSIFDRKVKVSSVDKKNTINNIYDKVKMLFNYIVNIKAIVNFKSCIENIIYEVCDSESETVNSQDIKNLRNIIMQNSPDFLIKAGIIDNKDNLIKFLKNLNYFVDADSKNDMLDILHAVANDQNYNLYNNKEESFTINTLFEKISQLQAQSDHEIISEEQFDEIKSYFNTLVSHGLLTQKKAEESIDDLQRRFVDKAEQIKIQSLVDSPELQNMQCSTFNFALKIGLPFNLALSFVDPNPNIANRNKILKNILSMASKRNLLTEQNIKSALQSISVENYVPSVAKLADDDLVNISTILDFIDYETIDPYFLAQALGVSCDDSAYEYYTQSQLIATHITVYLILQKAMPITVAQLKNFFAHPSIDMRYNLEKLKQSQMGQKCFEQVDPDLAYIFLCLLSENELEELNEMLQINCEPFKQNINIHDLVDKALKLGVLTPNNLLVALTTIGNQEALYQFGKYYSNANAESSISFMDKPTWESDINWSSYNVQSQLDHQVLKGISAVDNWESIAFILGVPKSIIDKYSNPDHVDFKCGLIAALSECVEQKIEITIEDLVSACKLLNKTEIVQGLPKSILYACKNDSLPESLSRLSKIPANLLADMIHCPERWKDVARQFDMPDNKINSYDHSNLENMDEIDQNRLSFIDILNYITYSNGDVTLSEKFKNYQPYSKIK